MPSVILLQDLISVRGLSSSDVAVQAADQWLDLGGYVDIKFHTQVYSGSGTSGRIYFQTSPTRDDGLFVNMDHNAAITTTGLKTGIERFSSATVPLSRYLRWRITASAAWDVTFRTFVTVRPG
jgi:hypothetical protein